MQLTHAAETGSPAIQVEMIMDHAKSRDRCDPFPALSEDRFQSRKGEGRFGAGAGLIYAKQAAPNFCIY
jgi:hypothetical protein